MTDSRSSYVKKHVARFVRNYIEQEGEPGVFLGITGSLARGDAGDLSDCDLLMVVDDDPLSFWSRLKSVGTFIRTLAAYLQSKLDCPVVVSSSLAAQDLMPFVAIDPDARKHVVLHVLIYPSPTHMVRWEPDTVWKGFLDPIKKNPECALIGNTKRLLKRLVRLREREDGEMAHNEIRSLDVCIQAFLAGHIQAYVRELHRSQFVARYSFHLFRYAAKYLLPLDKSSGRLHAICQDDNEPPVVAKTVAEAHALVVAWQRAWKKHGQEPLASQLPSLYDAAALYYSSLLSHITDEQRALSDKGCVRSRRSNWSQHELKIAYDLTKKLARSIYVVSMNRIRVNYRNAIRDLSDIAGGNIDLWFSVKAFPSTDLLNLLVSSGNSRFAIASYRELNLVRGAGIGLENILLHAPSLNSTLLASIGDSDIGEISISSLSQYEQVKDICQSQEVRVLARLRLPTHCRSKFGMSIKEFSQLNAARRTKIEGVHIHLGEDLYDKEKVGRAAKIVGRAVRMIVDKRGAARVNLGGGLRSVTCEEWLKQTGIEGFKQLVFSIAKEAGPAYQRCNVEFELGRRIVADAVVLVGHVLETRAAGEGAVHMLDCGIGMLPILRSTVCGVEVLKDALKARRWRGQLAGPACYERDRFGAVEVSAARGDVVVFSNVGAYSAALASGFGGDFPAIHAFDGGGAGKTEVVEWHLWRGKR